MIYLMFVEYESEYESSVREEESIKRSICIVIHFPQEILLFEIMYV